jgi:hypothetical protein
MDPQFPWQNSMPFSDRDRFLKQVRALGTLKFRPRHPVGASDCASL